MLEECKTYDEFIEELELEGVDSKTNNLHPQILIKQLGKERL